MLKRTLYLLRLDTGDRLRYRSLDHARELGEQWSRWPGQWAVLEWVRTTGGAGDE